MIIDAVKRKIKVNEANKAIKTNKGQLDMAMGFKILEAVRKEYDQWVSAKEKTKMPKLIRLHIKDLIERQIKAGLELEESKPNSSDSDDALMMLIFATSELMHCKDHVHLVDKDFNLELLRETYKLAVKGLKKRFGVNFTNMPHLIKQTFHDKIESDRKEYLKKDRSLFEPNSVADREYYRWVREGKKGRPNRIVMNHVLELLEKSMHLLEEDPPSEDTTFNDLMDSLASTSELMKYNDAIKAFGLELNATAELHDSTVKMLKDVYGYEYKQDQQA